MGAGFHTLSGDVSDDSWDFEMKLYFYREVLEVVRKKEFFVKL